MWSRLANYYVDLAELCKDDPERFLMLWQLARRALDKQTKGKSPA